MPLLDLAGLRFGRLIAISYSGNRRWSCVCDCGNKVEIQGHNLRIGKTRSCGCFKRERMAEGLGTRHGMYRSPTHKSWESMLARCTVETDPTFSRYGGAGVKVCDRWGAFENFLVDMGDRPAGTSLDRVDGSKGYEPGNCRWATPNQQANNTKANLRVTYNGKTYTVRELSDLTGTNYHTLRDRIKRGWDAARAVSEPINRKRNKE